MARFCSFCNLSANSGVIEAFPLRTRDKEYKTLNLLRLWCLAIMLRHYASRASVVVLVFTGAKRPLFFKSSILATNRSLRTFNIAKIAAKRSQRAMLNGQYWVFNDSFRGL